MAPSPKLRWAVGSDSKRLMYWCPGCKEVHGIPVKKVDVNHTGPIWGFDGNFQSPSFNPSVKHSDQDGTFCHYFIKNGKFEYCADCKHDLKGQKVEMVDWPYSPGSYGGIED